MLIRSSGKIQFFNKCQYVNNRNVLIFKKMINLIYKNQVNTFEINCPLTNGNDIYNHSITIKMETRFNQLKRPEVKK